MKRTERDIQAISAYCRYHVRFSLIEILFFYKERWEKREHSPDASFSRKDTICAISFSSWKRLPLYILLFLSRRSAVRRKQRNTVRLHISTLPFHLMGGGASSHLTMEFYRKVDNIISLYIICRELNYSVYSQGKLI